MRVITAAIFVLVLAMVPASAQVGGGGGGKRNHGGDDKKTVSG